MTYSTTPFVSCSILVLKPTPSKSMPPHIAPVIMTMLLHPSQTDPSAGTTDAVRHGIPQTPWTSRSTFALRLDKFCPSPLWAANASSILHFPSTLHMSVSPLTYGKQLLVTDRSLASSLQALKVQALSRQRMDMLGRNCFGTNVPTATRSERSDPQRPQWGGKVGGPSTVRKGGQQ